jgi:hypothetical protein
MARSARDPVRVLDLLHVLYELGSVTDLEPGALVGALDRRGLRGFAMDEEPFYLMIGEVLGLLLKQSSTDPGTAFTAARRDLLARRPNPS